VNVNFSALSLFKALFVPAWKESFGDLAEQVADLVNECNVSLPLGSFIS